VSGAISMVLELTKITKPSSNLFLVSYFDLWMCLPLLCLIYIKLLTNDSVDDVFIILIHSETIVTQSHSFRDQSECSIEKLYAKENKKGEWTCLQYTMLITPAKTRGTIEIIPFLSSTRSMMNIAMIDVKATVIWNDKQIGN
jgi:hypothetical protein